MKKLKKEEKKKREERRTKKKNSIKLISDGINGRHFQRKLNRWHQQQLKQPYP